MYMEVKVEAHKTKEDLLLYMTREFDISYTEAKERYSQSTEL